MAVQTDQAPGRRVTIPLLADAGQLRIGWIYVIAFLTNTGSLRQQIVPNELLGRVISIAGVLAWSAIPIGTLLGGLAIERTGNVALVFGVIGALVVVVALAFSLSPIGRAERYLEMPAEQPPDRAAPGARSGLSDLAGV